MLSKKHKLEEIFGKLREVAIVLGEERVRPKLAAGSRPASSLLSLAEGIWRPEDRPSAADEDVPVSLDRSAMLPFVQSRGPLRSGDDSARHFRILVPNMAQTGRFRPR
jgi:hypothetical protein